MKTGKVKKKKASHNKKPAADYNIIGSAEWMGDNGDFGLDVTNVTNP